MLYNSFMKVAIVHDDFMQWGGAERVVLAMSEIWPDAPIYTMAYDENVLPDSFPVDRLRTSFMNRPLIKKLFYPKLFFLDPLFFELFSFNNYDIVVSSSTRFAKSVVTQPHTKHVAFINSPPRFLWPVSEGFTPNDYAEGFISKMFFIFRPLVRLLLPLLLSILRVQDYVSAQRATKVIGNSHNVANRIHSFYKRTADVIYPFVELERFKSTSLDSIVQGDYYLIVSRLSEHKRIDLAIEACNELNKPLKIIGTGSEREYLERIAGDSIELLGFVSDQEVEKYISGCKAFIYPQEEDFGITAIEAQASGKPVIAYKAGGAIETVIDGKTGILFTPQTKEGLMQAITEFEAKQFDPKVCIENAESFSRETFKEKMRQYIETVFAE